MSRIGNNPISIPEGVSFNVNNGVINVKGKNGEMNQSFEGVSFDISRRYQSGFTLGAFVTKTNLSAEEFGEGSFDKGFYISIPTSMFYSDFRTGNIVFGLQPLTKDGGSKLIQHNLLYSLLADTNERSILRDWSDLLR